MKKMRAVACALSLALATVPIAACSQNAKDNGEEEMTREISLTGEIIEVTTNEKGEYDVTITEDNLMEDQKLAEQVPDVATAEDAGIGEEEMTRDAVSLDGEGTSAQDSGIEVKAEQQGDAGSNDAAAATDAQTSEGEGDISVVDDKTDASGDAAAASADKPEGTAADAQADESVQWSLDKVKKEDVTVVYNILKLVEEGQEAPAEPEYDTHEAEVTGFENDKGTIKLSFKAVEPGPLQTWTFTIRFAGTDSYAVVKTNPAPVDMTIEDVDFDAKIAALSEYKPDFAEEDIALPKGTYIEDGELIVTDEATDVVQGTVTDMGIGEEEMSRDGNVTPGEGGDIDAGVEAEPAQGDQGGRKNSGGGGSSSGSGSDGSGSSGANDAALEYMQEYNNRKKQYDNYDALARYTPEILGEIDPRAGKVAEMGANAYYIFKGYTTNNWGAGIEGSLGVLKMFGLFKGSGSQGVTNAQILSEVQKVGLEVADMHGLTKAMNSKLDATLQQAYKNNLQSFDNAVLSLNLNAEIVQTMLTEGAIRATEDGIQPPAEDCDAEDEFEYNYNLIQYIKRLEKEGGRKNSAFDEFSSHMTDLTKDFSLVASEVAKPPETNPLTSYDEYWNLYFNYDSQGYYLRRSYRSSIEYELKRGFALMEIYYNIFDPYTKGTHLPYNQKLFSALDRLEQLDAGLSPSQVKKDNDYWRPKLHVRLNTFERTIVRISYASNASGPSVATGLLEEYIKRLHGRSVQDDLSLAGLWSGRLMQTSGNVTTAIDQRWWGDPSLYVNGAHGIGFNGTTKDDWYIADIIGYDNQLHRTEKTLSKKGKTLPAPFDKPSSTSWAWSMPYMLYGFA